MANTDFLGLGWNFPVGLDDGGQIELAPDGAPLIDERSQADVVAQITQLAGQFSGWQPTPDGQPDAGQALIGVFGRFAGLVIERLNRAPDKNYLAFLNLIGASPLPPRPARVP